MDLLLARRAGARPPGVETLRAALQRQRWLAPDPIRRGPWARVFTFPGGQVHMVTRPGDVAPHVAPGLLASLLPDADFATVAPRLVSLAAQLRLGVDTAGSSGALWWPAPDPASLEPATLGRAIAVSRACDAREAWPLLGFALAGPECLELAESHPALAVLVANTARVAGRYRADIPAEERSDFLRALSRRARREILAALDFPATESMVRLLGKIPADRLNLESLRLLRDLRLAPHAAKALRHLPRFGSGLIPIVVRRKLWPHVGPQLLREVAEEADEGGVYFRLRDTVEMAESLGRLGEIGIVPTRAALDAFHDQLQHDYETRAQRNLREARRREEALAQEAERRARQLAARPERRVPVEPPALEPPPPPPPRKPPRPPIPEPPRPPPGFVPLRTRADLTQEGREMSHCVGSYWPSVERGDCAVYRVLEPERATLSLRWSKARGTWSVEQVKGFANKPVRAETRLFIRDWIASGGVDPVAARWAREQARGRFRELLQRAQQVSDPAELRRLKEELSRSWVAPPPRW